MNITFENNRVGTGSNVDKVTTSNSNSQIKETSTKGVVALDISGTVMDNTAYDGQGKTAEDVMQEAGQIDVATQKNYMAVMSNTMSTEDFAKLQEEGGHPGSTEIETVVTIVDEIKAALVKGGKNIAGYTDDLDVETLTQITGSAGFANEIVKQLTQRDIPITKENVEGILKACDRAGQLTDMNPGVMKYMIRNHMEPTVDNIYKAQHSATPDAGRQGKGYYQDEAGYYARKADSYNWQQLESQMEKVIQDAGLNVSEETLSDAKWLIEKGVPLTEESLRDLYELKNIQTPQDWKQIVSAAAAAIADGKNAGNADMADNRTFYEKAQDYMDDINFISGEAADKVAAEGKILNLRNLKAAQIQLNISISVRTETYAVSVSGRRQLEEVRLQMTVEANFRLLRSGFAVDTAKLEQLVEALKAAEQERQQILFGSDTASGVSDRATLYQNTLEKIGSIPFMPASLVGRFALQGGVIASAASASFTLEAVYQEGSTLRNAYEKAGETYEALMTAPRADLGDSIKKAFRNVDDILQDMNLDTSEENRRAVRILGYNRMAVTEDNIFAVKATDLTINRVLDKMKPASVLQMIRDGINPLSMSMEELEDYYNKETIGNPGQDIEKYSEYLYKLDKNGGITPEERDSFIGIYRLFRQLEKTDGAAIGTLINQGAELTVSNLLTAMRSNKRHGMNVAVDDSFGGVDSVYRSKSISGQIGSGYESSYHKKLASDIFDKLDGGKMSAQMMGKDISLEEFSDMLQKTESDAETDSALQKLLAEQMRAAGKAEDRVIKELLWFKQPVTTDNLLAAGLLMKERGKLAGKIREFASDTDNTEKLEEAISDFHGSMEDEVSAKAAYDKLQQTYTDILEDVVYNQETSRKIDIKEIGNIYKQISLTGNLAKEDNYEVPVVINGEITSINLRVIHDKQDRGRVTASMDSLSYGKVTAQFQITQKVSAESAEMSYQMSGYLVSDSEMGIKMLSQGEEALRKAMIQSDIQIVSLNLIYNKELDLTTAAAGQEKKETDVENKTGSTQGVPTKKLYETAKIFIGYIQKGEGLTYEDLL